MAKFFQPNIDRRGRLARAIFAAVLIVAGFGLLRFSGWASAAVWVGGVFSLFEALRGWCVMRACGVKTKY